MKGASYLLSDVMKEHNSFAPQRREGRREELKFISRDLSALLPTLRCKLRPISRVGGRCHGLFPIRETSELKSLKSEDKSLLTPAQNRRFG